MEGMRGGNTLYIRCLSQDQLGQPLNTTLKPLHQHVPAALCQISLLQDRVRVVILSFDERGGIPLFFCSLPSSKGRRPSVYVTVGFRVVIAFNFASVFN